VERYKTRTGIRKLPSLLLGLVKAIIIAFLLYLLVSNIFINTFQIKSVSMEPILKPNDRVIVSIFSYGRESSLFKKRLGLNHSPKRGDIVIITPPYVKGIGFWREIANTFVDFFSLHTATLLKDAAGNKYERYMVKRVIALPGDTVYMKNFIAYIKPQGSTRYTIETKLIKKNYKITKTIKAKNWKNGLPFSGNMEPITLAENQYFVLGDNRPDSSDSRSWGALDYSRIIGKVLLRYWPLNEFGKLSR